MTTTLFKSFMTYLIFYFLLSLTLAHKRWGHSSDSDEYRGRGETRERDLPQGDQTEGRYRGGAAAEYGSRGRGSSSHGRGRPDEEQQPVDSPQDICPCVKRKDTGECITYDPRLQAVSLEEAVVNFPDLQLSLSGTNPPVEETTAGNLSMPGPPSEEFGPTESSDNLTLAGPVAKSRVGPKAGGPEQPSAASTGAPVSAGLCGDNQECQQCSAVLLSRLSRAGLVQDYEMEQVSRRLGIHGAPSHQACQKYRFGRTAPSQFKKTAAKPLYENATAGDGQLYSLIKQLQQKGEEHWAQQGNSSERVKRQTGKAGLKLGQQHKIDCSKRGEPIEQGSTWVGLCNVCWAWRKLPSSYFPQYINELICDTDRKCMSGWGKCQQRYKTVDILHNTGTHSKPSWKQVTVSVANYCDCEVESGSGMHNFVAA